MHKPILDELIALHHSARSAAETLSEAIEEQAEQANVSKSALRKVVAALADDKADKLDAEATAILALLGDDHG
jgi:hypothetical protein